MSDLISRQAVLDLAERGKLVSNGNYKSVCDDINGLPSVEPERKTGKWIENGTIRQCNMCRALYPKGQRCGAYHYCPNCGSKMEVDG